jgi:hypothetical protein
VYDADESPAACFSSAVTEAFHACLGIDRSWMLSNTVKVRSLRELPGTGFLSGMSLNLDHDVLVGVVGWKGSKVISPCP